MKTRKVSLLLIVLVILLSIFSLACVGRKAHLRVKIDYPYGPSGWAWVQGHIKLDPNTGEASGLGKFTAYTDVPENLGYWVGPAVCGSLGESAGKPAMDLVFRIDEVNNMPEEWVGKYMKIFYADGGNNPEDDLLGIVVWDPVTGPVIEQPSCEFEVPVGTWSPTNGKIVIFNTPNQ